MGKFSYVGLAFSKKVNQNKEEGNKGSVITKEQALSVAEKYCLENEVEYCIDVLHMTPEEALHEWDI